jgi:two-component system, OmpR family, phosphate regulon response regulator OmpR
MSEPVVVLVEDEPQIRRFLRTTLGSQGYRLFEAATGADGLVEAASRQPDVVIVDLGLPDIDGLEVIRRLREWSTVPIIVLSARGQEADKVVALDLGADDYVSKPFEPKELSLRIAGVLRRARPAMTPAVESVRFGDFRFHILRGELKRGEDTVRLTDRERDMLRLLAATPGETVPRQALAGNGGATGERAVDVQVNRLRRKIEQDPANPLLVQTVRGIGYRLVTTP